MPAQTGFGEKDMKYILHIAAKLDIGGAEKVARDIGLYSDPRVYQHHYVVFWPEMGAYEPEILDHGGKVFHIASPGKSYVKFLKELKRLMKDYPYTAVHAHTMFNAGWVMLIAKLMKVPVRVAHAHSALNTGKQWKKALYESVMRFLVLTCATDLVACGEKAGIRLFGRKAYEKRARLILNGIDTERFRFNEQSRNAMRKKLGLEDAFVIGHAGHFAKVKNQQYLLNLMPEILKTKPNAVLLLLGDGADRPMLEKMVSELELADAVIMTGNVMNVPDYLNAMDVFAFPSLYEGMPLSIVEVQTNGLPCILSTGVPEDVYLTDLVMPLPLEDPDKWAEAILGSRRCCSEKYACILRNAGVDVSAAMGKIYKIYETN